VLEVHWDKVKHCMLNLHLTSMITISTFGYKRRWFNE